MLFERVFGMLSPEKNVGDSDKELRGFFVKIIYFWMRFDGGFWALWCLGTRKAIKGLKINGH